MPATIRILIVDDSAFVRKVVREMLAHDTSIEVVGAARDGEEALVMAAELNPDVITCDLSMPRLDGVGFVRRQMARRPVPILILTASPQDAELVLEAMSAGAIDVVQKPTALATEQLLTIRSELIEKVASAARASPHSDGVQMPEVVLAPPLPSAATRRLKMDLVVLGISTGGPQALRRIVPQFPPDFPVPIAIVMHMPVGYTALFAEKLNEISKLRVTEAKEGDALLPGRVLIAPAGRHLSFRREGKGALLATLSIHPLDKPHRPSVDILFQSAAELCRNRVLAVVMTGMGDDGKQGATWVKSQGGVVITESEASCVIYGMPRSVVEAGLSDVVIPLDAMVREITSRI